LRIVYLDFGKLRGSQAWHLERKLMGSRYAEKSTFIRYRRIVVAGRWMWLMTVPGWQPQAVRGEPRNSYPIILS